MTQNTVASKAPILEVSHRNKCFFNDSFYNQISELRWTSVI